MSAKPASSSAPLAPSLDPTYGPTAGGRRVKITAPGGPWDEETIMALEVMFGQDAAEQVDVGEPVPGPPGTYKNIFAISPPHTLPDANSNEDVVEVVLVPPGSAEQPVGSFKYIFTVNSVYPLKAEVGNVNDWDEAVMITGDDMGDVQAVYFGKVPTQFGLVSPSHIWAIVPYPTDHVPIPPGGYSVPVTVKTPRGQNAKNSFTYYPA